MKNIALLLILGLACTAAAGYKEAGAVLKNLDVLESKELDGLLEQPGAALVKDARAATFLSENQAAMELYRQAAEEPSDGYLLGAKPEKPSAKTPLPSWPGHVKLTKLMLLEAKISGARKQFGRSEKNILSAAGFLVQLSEQKWGCILSSMMQQFWMQKAYQVLSESLRGASASPAYLKELAARLDKVEKNQDFMRSAMLQEAEIEKSTMLETINSETMAAERAKLDFLRRLGAKKLQDQEFFSAVYSGFNASVDARFGILVGAFRANDPAPAAAAWDKLQREVLARKEVREKRGTIAGIIDGLKGGPEAKKEMAQIIIDNMLIINSASYEKIIPRYHLYLCELNVLRAVIAVKLYQRARKRLPDTLEQLVPTFLGAVPRDSFNKFAPLSYVKKGGKFSVYSFGPDWKDGGGTAVLDREAYAEDPARDSGDIVFAD